MRVLLALIIFLFSLAHTNTIYAQRVPYKKSRASFTAIKIIPLTKKIYPGNTFELTIEGLPHSKSIAIVLQKDNKTIVRSEAIVQNKRTHPISFIGFLGLPSSLEPGNYSIALEKKTSTTLYAPKNIQILPKSFKKDIVKIPPKKVIDKENKAEQRKIRNQAKFAWKLTGSIMKENIYQYKNFELPVKKYKYITGTYGDRRIYTNSKNKKIGQSIHGGVDFAAPTHTPIYSPAKGKVVFVKYRIVTGYTIIISHYPGIFTLYYHLNKIDTTLNSIVYANEKIGEIGTTGLSTGAHLHWELRVNNVQVNPLEFLKEEIALYP